MSYAGLPADSGAMNPQMRNLLLAQMLMRGNQQPQGGQTPWSSLAGAGGNVVNAMMMQRMMQQPQSPQGGTPQPPMGGATGMPAQLSGPAPSQPGASLYSPTPAMPGQTMPRPGMPPLGPSSLPGQQTPYGTGQLY